MFKSSPSITLLQTFIFKKKEENQKQKSEKSQPSLVSIMLSNYGFIILIFSLWEPILFFSLSLSLSFSLFKSMRDRCLFVVENQSGQTPYTSFKLLHLIITAKWLYEWLFQAKWMNRSRFLLHMNFLLCPIRRGLLLTLTFVECASIVS